MALSAGRDTKERSGDRLNLGVAAAKTCYAGGLAAVDANGDATPGATATTLKGAGRFAETVDNAAGSAGDKRVEIEKGIFLFGNSADGDEITTAEIGDDCYIVDDETVAKTDDEGARSVAGKVFDVSAAGVWVKFD